MFWNEETWWKTSLGRIFGKFSFSFNIILSKMDFFRLVVWHGCFCKNVLDGQKSDKNPFSTEPQFVHERLQMQNNIFNELNTCMDRTELCCLAPKRPFRYLIIEFWFAIDFNRLGQRAHPHDGDRPENRLLSSKGHISWGLIPCRMVGGKLWNSCSAWSPGLLRAVLRTGTNVMLQYILLGPCPLWQNYH